MKKIIVGLFMLFAVSFAAQNSWASCPNEPITCSYGAIGWQGTCFHGLKGCQACGPRHCPTLITSYKKLQHQINTPCLSKILASRVDGCSVPKAVGAIYKGIFKAACDEHDICYHSNISKTNCDNYFHGNMNQICDSYYTGLLNRAQETACKAAANAFYLGVHMASPDLSGYTGDQDWKKKNCK